MPHRLVSPIGRFLGCVMIVTACSPASDSAIGDTAHLSSNDLQATYPGEVRAGNRIIPAGVIARGDTLYHRVRGTANCIVCHGPYLAGGSHGTDLRDEMWHHADGSLESIARVIRDGVESAEHSPIPHMPPAGGFPLTNEEIEALAAYIYWFSQTQPTSAREDPHEDEHEHAH